MPSVIKLVPTRDTDLLLQFHKSNKGITSLGECRFLFCIKTDEGNTNLEKYISYLWQCDIDII